MDDDLDEDYGENLDDYIPLYGFFRNHEYHVAYNGESMTLNELFENHPERELSNFFLDYLYSIETDAFTKLLKDDYFNANNIVPFLRELFDEYRQNGGHPMVWLKETFKDISLNPQSYKVELRFPMEKALTEWMEVYSKMDTDHLLNYTRERMARYEDEESNNLIDLEQDTKVEVSIDEVLKNNPKIFYQSIDDLTLNQNKFYKTDSEVKEEFIPLYDLGVTKENVQEVFKRNFLRWRISNSHEVFENGRLLSEFDKTMLLLPSIETKPFNVDVSDTTKQGYPLTIEMFIKEELKKNEPLYTQTIGSKINRETNIKLKIWIDYLNKKLSLLQKGNVDAKIKPKYNTVIINGDSLIPSDIEELISEFKETVDPTLNYYKSSLEYKKTVNDIYTKLIDKIKLLFSIKPVHKKEYKEYFISTLNNIDYLGSYEPSEEAKNILKVNNISFKIFFVPPIDEQYHVHRYQNYINKDYSYLDQNPDLLPDLDYDLIKIHYSFISYISEYYINELKNKIKALSLDNENVNADSEFETTEIKTIKVDNISEVPSKTPLTEETKQETPTIVPKGYSKINEKFDTEFEKCLYVMGYHGHEDKSVIDELINLGPMEIYNKYFEGYAKELKKLLMSKETKDAKRDIIKFYLFDLQQMEYTFRYKVHLFDCDYYEINGAFFIDDDGVEKKLSNHEIYIVKCSELYHEIMYEIQRSCSKLKIDFIQVCDELRFNLEYCDYSLYYALEGLIIEEPSIGDNKVNEPNKKTEANKSSGYSFSASQWASIFYYTRDRESVKTIIVQISDFKIKYNIPITQKSLRSNYYTVQKGILNNCYNHKHLLKIIPFLSANYPKIAKIVKKDIEYMKNEVPDE